MIHDLLKGYADLGLSSTADLLHRRDTVDFTIPVYSWQFVAFFLHPNLRRDNFAMFRPFNNYLWMAVIGYLIIFSVVIILAKFVTEHSPTHGVQEIDNTSVQTSGVVKVEGASLLWTMNMICSKSIPHIPTYYVSVMAVTFSGFVFGFLLSVTYSAMLFSFLSLPLTPFSSLDDLLQNSYYVGTVGSPVVDLFMVSDFTKPSVAFISAPCSFRF